VVALVVMLLDKGLDLDLKSVWRLCLTAKPQARGRSWPIRIARRWLRRLTAVRYQRFAAWCAGDFVILGIGCGRNFVSRYRC